MRRVVALCVGCLLGLAILTTSSSAQRPIFFAANSNGESASLYSLDSEFGQVKKLGIKIAGVSKIQRSPGNGDKLLVRLGNEEKLMMAVIDTEGRIIRKISLLPDADLPMIDLLSTWHPSGQAITTVQMNRERGTFDIANIDIATGRVQTIVIMDKQLYPLNPTWSPDRKTLAFSYIDADNVANAVKANSYPVVLCSVNPQELPYHFSGFNGNQPAGPQFKLLAETKIIYLVMSHFLQWSANSRRLAFFTTSFPHLPNENSTMTQNLDKASLYYFDLGTPTSFHYDIAEGDYIPDAVLSPDGTRFAYGVLDGIWIWNIDPNTKLHLATAPQLPPFHISWSPDGKQLVFDSGSRLYYVDAATAKTSPALWDPEITNISALSW